MNGAVAESMARDGQKYGLNYGVSIATIREIVATETPDYDFAKYLYKQQVRELKIAACHLAPASSVDTHEFPFWSRGIINPELAEELAFALGSPYAHQRVDIVNLRQERKGKLNVFVLPAHFLKSQKFSFLTTAQVQLTQ